MLSTRRCREILGKDCRPSDEDLQQLLSQLYGLAETAILTLEAECKAASRKLPESSSVQSSTDPSSETNREPAFSDVLSMLSEDDQYAVEERAAIHEFDGHCSREEAEQYALQEYWASELERGRNGK